MVDIAGAEQLAASDRLERLSHQNAVHGHAVADGKIFGGKFLLSGNIGDERNLRLARSDGLAFFQVIQRDEDVVAGIELQHSLHGLFKL